MFLPLILAALIHIDDLPLPPQIPQQVLSQKHLEIELAFLTRWEAFQRDRIFTPFFPEKSDEVLEKEFETIQKTRRDVWFQNPEELIKESKEGYEMAESLIFEEGVRAKNALAFAYNNTIPYYNATTLYLNGLECITCEAPQATNVSKFLKMLLVYHVTHLVRLTPSREKGEERCYPYWEGLLKSEANGESLELLAFYPVRLFIMEEWGDSQGVNPKKLLELVLQVRRELKETKGRLAVHCSAGVGRSGTFLAALMIAEALEQEIPFSIEEIVYRLSLQRIYSVARAEQYITLHRLAEEYLNPS